MSDARPSFDDIYIAMTFLLAARSTCARLRVGAVVASADGRQVFSVGYNGNAAGLPNGCDSTEPGACGCLHAECNALINCTAPRDTKKAVYVSDSPCVACAKSIVNLGGVQRVVYARPYRITTSLELFRQVGIEVVRFDMTRLPGLLAGLPGEVPVGG